MWLGLTVYFGLNVLRDNEFSRFYTYVERAVSVGKFVSDGEGSISIKMYVVEFVGGMFISGMCVESVREFCCYERNISRKSLYMSKFTKNLLLTSVKTMKKKVEAYL